MTHVIQIAPSCSIYVEAEVYDLMLVVGVLGVLVAGLGVGLWAWLFPRPVARQQGPGPWRGRGR